MNDSEHKVTIGEITTFVRSALGVSQEESVGGRLIDSIETDIDGIVVTMSNGQAFRIGLFEVR